MAERSPDAKNRRKEPDMLGAGTRWMQMLVMVLGSLFAAFTMNACESTPKWVKTGTYSGQDSKAFYGVGEVMGIRNEPLAWDAAENRARAQWLRCSPPIPPI